ncbi:hypothetical protein AC578_7354 [Pseudocercospora eumusae]|uniref:Uncharacterized protein n=1 Tax=Pseudocercospora eumusae TaxID=321146 RepID=A0A139GUH1_9PEZI|nr:hypothetical protein AC578_7354 [Pseudocercospora eumusae]
MASVQKRPPKSTRSKDAYDMEKRILYDRIFESSYRSAYHTSEILYNELSAAERNAIINEPRVQGPETLSGKGPLPRDTALQRPAGPELAKVLPQARARWAKHVRDHQLRDIDVVFQGTSTECRGLLTIMKDRMSLAGGRPYHAHDYDESTRTMCFSIVIAQSALNGLSPPEMMKDFQMQILDNVGPDLPDGTTEACTTSAEATPDQQNVVAMSAKRRGKQVRFGDPPDPSCYPIPSSEMEQAEWSETHVPFTREYSDHHPTDDDWWLRDLPQRTQMIADWQEKRTPRRLALAFGDDPSTLPPPIAPEVMPGLCDTYAANVPQAKQDERGIQLLRVLFTDFLHCKAKCESAERSYTRRRSTYRRLRAQPLAVANPGVITHLRRSLYLHPFHEFKLLHDTLEKRFHTACREVPSRVVNDKHIKDAALLTEVRKMRPEKALATTSLENHAMTNDSVGEQQEHGPEAPNPPPPQESFVTLSSPDASALGALEAVATANGVQRKIWSPLGLVRQVFHGMLRLPSLFSLGNGGPAAAA